MAGGSTRAVVSAIAVNAVITVLKFGAALATHSASMMNESIHSLMDTTNQVFLYLGIRSGARPPDRKYAFGHGQKKYLWNLWSAIGLFSIGCGLGLAHAWHAYHGGATVADWNPVTLFGTVTVDPIWISVVVLAIALVLELYVLWIAGTEYARRMRADGYRNPFEYMFKGNDPTLLAVVLEDAVAVLGVLLASAGIGLTRLTGDAVWDILFSVVIALMLGVVAIVLGYLNMRFLSDVRDRSAEASFAQVVGEHREVHRYHDLRSIVLDESHTVVVAEVELREERVLSGLRDRMREIEAEINSSLSASKRQDPLVEDYVSTRAAVQATLERTEQIIDELAQALRSRSPQVSHVTIEVQGIADEPSAS